jgi:hypothetical protein
MLNEKLNEKNGIHNDILMIIYNNLVSADGNKKYQLIMNKLRNYKILESAAQILAT